jgi:hypothetical protein
MPEKTSGDCRVRPLSAKTWPDFAALVEANNGVWGGCWCMGFHSEGLDKESPAEKGHRRSGVARAAVAAAEELRPMAQRTPSKT